MERISYFVTRHGIKLLIAVKIAVLTFVLGELGIVKLGDQRLAAQDKGKAEADAAKNKDAGKDAGKDGAKDADKDSPKEASKEEAKGTAATATDDSKPSTAKVANRRSYLEDLLDLPKVETTDIKKTEISRYLKILDKKHQQVADRITLLNKREENLKSLEQSVDDKLKKLDEEIQFFNQTLQKEKEVSKDRLTQLIEFYQKMTPKKAAPVFEKMDRDLVVALFQAIPKKQTMNILALMTPQKSVELSEYFGRLRSGKEYELLKQINQSLRDEFQECKGLPKDEKGENAEKAENTAKP